MLIIKISSIILFFFSCCYVYSNEIIFNSVQLSKQEFKLSICKSFFNKLGRFDLNKEEIIKVGQQQYFGETSKHIDFVGSGNRSFLKIIYNPYDELYWWLKFGTERQRIELPQNNKFDAFEPGYIVGFGTRYQIFPETIVSPGLCFDLGIDYSQQYFDRLYTEDVLKGIINNKIETINTQLSFIMTKRNLFIKNLEPFIGFNIYRIYNKLIDKNNLSSINGIIDNFNLSFGMKFKIFTYEWFLFESSLINDVYYLIGFGFGY